MNNWFTQSLVCVACAVLFGLASNMWNLNPSGLGGLLSGLIFAVPGFLMMDLYAWMKRTV